MAIGQGEVVATPLQLANAYAAFGNGGTVYRPHLALRAVKYDGTLLKNFDPEVTGQAQMSPTSRNAVLSGLLGAVNDSNGTAHSAFAGYDLPARVAGKTGTAQVPGKQDTALFVGFAPAESPDIAVSVVMEESGFGGTIAAPVARSIIQAYFRVPVAPLTPAGGRD
jgi:penicillin-binding protein 2